MSDRSCACRGHSARSCAEARYPAPLSRLLDADYDPTYAGHDDVEPCDCSCHDEEQDDDGDEE